MFPLEYPDLVTYRSPQKGTTSSFYHHQINFPKPFLPLPGLSRPVGATADPMRLPFFGFPLSSSWGLDERVVERAPPAPAAPESLLGPWLALLWTGLAFATRLPFWALDGQHWKESYADVVGGALFPPKPMKKQPSPAADRTVGSREGRDIVEG